MTCAWHRKMPIHDRAVIVRQQTCWTCGARPGHRCVTKKGKATPDHTNRWWAAKASNCSCEEE